MNPLTIAHIADSLEVGGAEVMLATLARMHHGEGHRVSVHCVYAEGPLAAALRNDGVEVFVHGPGAAFGTMRRLCRSLGKIRPDVVHCHNAASTIYGALAARLTSVPVVVSTRHSLADRQLFRQEVKFWITARLFCDTVAVVSEAVRRSVGSHALASPGKLALVRNGAAVAAGSGPPEPGRGGFVLVSVARLSVLKDHMTLLQAAVIARKTVPDLEVWLVGDGQQREALRDFAREAGIEESVHFAGERKDVGAFLSRADVFVLSSKTEGLPISLLEAMACGLPAIATRVGGIPEVAELSGSCELVPPSNPAALAEAICRYASQRESLAVLGARARQCYESFFSPQRMARDYMQLYRGVRPSGHEDAARPRLAAKEGCDEPL